MSRRFWLIVTPISFIALWFWASFDLRIVDWRLQTQSIVSDPEVEVVGIAWKQYGPLWPLLALRIPIAALGVDVLLHNTSSHAIEVSETYVVLRDTFGREVKGDLVQRGKYYDNVVIFPGESRPFWAGNVLYPSYPLLPLTWSEAEVHITIKQASSGALAALWRWEEVVVTGAGYDAEGNYIIEGKVPGAYHVLDNGGGIKPRVVVSFYNAQGEFIASEDFGVSGIVNTFNGTIDGARIPNGPIVSYVIHFAEAVP